MYVFIQKIIEEFRRSFMNPAVVRMVGTPPNSSLDPLLGAVMLRTDMRNSAQGWAHLAFKNIF